MEIRKIQKTGGASFTVTLPKKWIYRCKLKDKALVRISEEKAYTLIIKPSGVKKSILRSFLIIDDLNEQAFTRELIAHYISGVDEIVISGRKITPQKRTTIGIICGQFIGFELLDISSGKIIIKNVFDPTKFPMSQNLEKIFRITISMLYDSHKALANQDLALANDVIDRDLVVDKLYIAITRQLYVCIRNDISVEETGLDDIDLYFMQNVSTRIERIADHAVKIAKNVSHADITGTPISTSTTVLNLLISMMEKSLLMVKTLDKSIAHEILDSSEMIENQIYSKKTKKHKSSHAWDVLEDSLDRIRGYIMNMAETTIDQAVLKDK
jgi:phosphate uptake regulator